MIIKAGTYRWVDKPQNTETDFVDVPLVYFVYDGNAYYQFDTFSVYSTGEEIETIDGHLNTYFNGNELFARKTYVTGYDIEDGWGIFTPEDMPVSMQLFTVPIDTEVSDETAFNWFTSNTQMLIEAGTYRWNDILTYTESTKFDISINFSIAKTLKADDENMRVYLSDEPTLCTGLKYFYSNATTPHSTMLGYTPLDAVYWANIDGSGEPWNTVYDLMREVMPDYTVDENIKGYGQIFTITSDQYVPTNFGLWANENWKRVIKAGDYIINEKPDTSGSVQFNLTFNTDASDKTYYALITLASSDKLTFMTQDDSGNLVALEVYEGGTWKKEKARIISLPEDFAVSTLAGYEWFTANTDPYVRPDEPDPIVITYNGNEIGRITSGKVTLSCAEKKMLGDVVIAFGSAGSITYNGTVTTVAAGQTATLTCSGKVAKTDIVISLGT